MAQVDRDTLCPAWLSQVLQAVSLFHWWLHRGAAMTGDFRNVPPAESGAGGSDLCWERNESLQGHTVAMRPAWANASVLRVNLFSGETLSSPGHGLVLQQLVQRCGHGTAGGWLWLGLGAEGFLSACRYPFAFNKCLLQGMFVAQLLASWPAILLRGRIKP